MNEFKFRAGEIKRKGEKQIASVAGAAGNGGAAGRVA